MADLSELDNLLAELDHLEAPKPFVKPPTSSNTIPSTNSRPPASTPIVTKPTPAPTPAPAPSKPVVPAMNTINTPKAAKPNDWDELDALVAKFEASNNVKAPTTPSPAPMVPKPAPDPTPTPSKPSPPVSTPKLAPSKSSPPVSNPKPVPAPSPSAPDPLPFERNTRPYDPPSLPLDLNELPTADEPPSPKPNQTVPPPVNTQSSPKNSPRDEQNTNIRAIVMVNASPNNVEICGGCGQRVTAEHLLAMGKKWHPHHFSCSECKVEIVGDFYEYESKPKCKNCFETKYACSKCGTPISGEYYVGGGKLLHASCIERHTCGKCNKQIEATSRELQALEKHWHPACFVCTGCGDSLSGSFYNIEGMPYCDNCASSKTAVSQGTCGNCGKNISSGSFVTYKDIVYHSDCFLCQFCKALIDHSSFYDVAGKPACKTCASQH